MRRLLILLSLLLLLASCSVKNDTIAKNSDSIPDNKPMVSITENADKAVIITPIAPEKSIPEPPKTTVNYANDKPVVTFIELGAESCIPCKMMQPVMKKITDEYQGLVKVIFYDLYKDSQAGKKYGVRVMPTQVFLDKEGNEFFRHEGFFSQADIEKMLLEKAGLKKPEMKGHTEQNAR